MIGVCKGFMELWNGTGLDDGMIGFVDGDGKEVRFSGSERGEVVF